MNHTSSHEYPGLSDRRQAAGLRAEWRDAARRHTSRRNLLRWGGAVSVAALLAYSGADEAIQRWHRGAVKRPRTDRLAATLHFFGERFWVGVWAVAALVDARLRTTPVSRWGRRVFTAFLVGLPCLWLTQRLLGGSRPGERPHGPRFAPLADDNAASGHTFVSATPLLVLARSSSRPWVRALSGLASPLGGWSRLNDDKHYLSQVLLGYVLAWAAAETATSPAASPAGDPPVRAQSSE